MIWALFNPKVMRQTWHLTIYLTILAQGASSEGHALHDIDRDKQFLSDPPDEGVPRTREIIELQSKDEAQEEEDNSDMKVIEELSIKEERDGATH